MTIVNKLPTIVASCVGAANLGGGVYRIDLADGTTRTATAPEITSAQSLVDSDIASAAQLLSDKSDMKTAYTTAVTRLQAISTATFANNAQRDVAIQDLAKYLLAAAKVVKGLL